MGTDRGEGGMGVRLSRGGGFGIMDRFSITYRGIRLVSFGMRWYESKIVSKGKSNKGNLGVHIHPIFRSNFAL